MPRGEKRAGGRPKGSKGTKTLEKEEARRLLRELVIRDLQPLVEAQKANAMGIKYLVVRDKTGKFIRVGEAMAKLATDESVVEVWEKDPSVQAFTDLLNRTLDKPTEHVEMEHSGEVTVLEDRIKAGRERARRG